MNKRLATTITGWFFVAAAVLFWGGWMLLHVRLGQYFQADDFSSIKPHLAYWISMYRMHIFGIVLSALAFSAFASLFTESPARVLVWPGAAVACGGMFVWAVATAFYYHFGAWGGLTCGDKPVADRQALADALLLNTEYLCCLVRFGHVFSGLGLLVIGAGLLTWKILPKWLGVWAAAMGVAAMAVTMGLPEYPQYYVPVFHAFPLWMACVGATLLKSNALIPGE
jgi:hypothetical protein